MEKSQQKQEIIFYSYFFIWKNLYFAREHIWKNLVYIVSFVLPPFIVAGYWKSSDKTPTPIEICTWLYRRRTSIQSTC